MTAPRKAMELGRDIAVGGTLCTVGDGAAQYAFNKAADDGVDARRLGAMTSYGSWSAVIYHYWYAFLARRLPPTAYMQKAALDCFVITPGFEIPARVGVFLSSTLLDVVTLMRYHRDSQNAKRRR